MMQLSSKRSKKLAVLFSCVMVIYALGSAAYTVLEDNGMSDDIEKRIWEKGLAFAGKVNPRVPKVIETLRCECREMHL